MRRVSAFLLLLCLSGAAQTPATQPPANPHQARPSSSSPGSPEAAVDSASPLPEPPHSPLSQLLSPQAAYDQANLPLDITRRETSNWSDTELAALDVAVAQAKHACIARASETYTGADLIGYARLCAMGKQWRATYLAATTYINGTDPKPLLAEAYGYEVQADMNLNNEKGVEGASIAMLRSVPYTSLTDDVTTAAIRFLQFAYLPDALDLAFQRQPYILNLLREFPSVSGSPSLDPSQSSPAAPQPPPVAAKPVTDIPIHTLFEHALVLAALQQYNESPERAAAEVADINQAMPAVMSSDETIFVAADQRQYALLGTPFPALPGAVSLRTATEKSPSKPVLGESTLFLLFPPWCVQCIRQAQDILPMLLREAAINGSDQKLHIYALLADNPPPPQPAAKPAPHGSAAQPHRPSQAGKTADKSSEEPTITITQGKPPTAEEQLRATPTLVVAPSTLADFNAMDFPFLIAVDHEGIIRLMVSAAPRNLLVDNGPAEQISDTILQHWPSPANPPAHPAR